MVSVHTNSANLTIRQSLNSINSDLSASMTRLGTGKRINSAKDDAAGLQIAVRLQAQNRGMGVAMQNAQNATSMLQTADGAFNEVTNILYRMKDLATQAADGASTAKDREAMQAEYDELGAELSNIMANTSYGGEKLLNKGDGKLASALTLQIGANTSETMTVDISASLSKLDTSFGSISAAFKGDGAEDAVAGKELIDGASAQIDAINAALEDVSAVRSSIGASQNRLSHVTNNLNNMSANMTDAYGRITDTDMAAESANMTAKQVLMQTSTAMLKQSSSMSQMVLSLIQ
ncbi:flagellin [Burkholderia ubonensis]|uniref:flagellin N-terminal helical domain-containing protein n=1 Tax=Burkholderia ubonensis TaxID=101571 RepID=UPI000752CD11|nr:flagellin [Burkholderia ubonensis]KVO87650.1 flagellin [Burkholderia ubonensis]KVZ57267.1 flagellin [Burkholderia ubonensis]KVZ72965.1 flagellin [Burkholderia ubonensis]